MRWLWGFVVVTACGIRVPPIASQFSDQCAQLYAAHDLDQAEAACNHALEYQPRYWDALHNKGLIQLARGHSAQAKALFIQAVRANPDMAAAYSLLGLLALDERDFATARDHFRAALHVNPEFAEARHNLGIACLRADDLDCAEQAFRQLTLTAPMLSEPYAQLGNVMLLRQRPADAVTWFEKAITLEQGYADAWKGLGAAFSALGNTEQAREAFTNCLEAKPDEPECTTLLQRIR
jgi:protein O-GlcNAc transferase